MLQIQKFAMILVKSYFTIYDVFELYKFKTYIL